MKRAVEKVGPMAKDASTPRLRLRNLIPEGLSGRYREAFFFW
ncbi:MAG: hypothetical protein C0483_11375 [Pirellula sp.]|nr:hypothetical protein [Pirellula sp.]